MLGTSNKTEILLGYSTVFGDNASSLNPIGDLYKQQVWQLSEHLGLPGCGGRARRRRPISGPARPTRASSASTTRIADEVLYLLFDQGLTAARGGRARLSRAGGRRRSSRSSSANRFKRRLMLIARLSGSAVNLDREIPRD